MKPEIREFSVHKNILLSVMQAQAGSLSKALMEGVMNSIDADATRVAIKLDSTTYSISDNGIGIQDRQSILDYFETFGTPHEEGDAKLGVFRIGRGQLMSFAATTWRTGTFSMKVDIENGSLGYALTENLPKSNGCSILGKLYDSLDDAAMREVERDFKELVKYAPINVYLNGRLISRNPEKLKWDFEDENAYYKLNSSEDLNLYNLGLLVTRLPAYRFGTGGLVVSKKQLKVNFARNDVLQNKCEVWKQIDKGLKQSALLKTMNKQSLNSSERNFLVRQWLYGTNSAKAEARFAGLKLFTVATGRHISLNQLLEQAVVSGGRVSAAVGAKSQLASRLHRDGVAVVLSTRSLERFYASDLDEMATQLRMLSNKFDSLKFTPLEELATDFSESFNQVSDEDADEQALFMMQALRDNHERFFKWFQSGEASSGLRSLVVGKSDVALAWTDGVSYIALSEKELLKAAKLGEIGCFNLLLTLTHEYCHDDADLESHEHDIVFMTKHHDLVQYQGGQLFKIAKRVNSSFNKLTKSKNIQRTSKSTQVVVSTLEAHSSLAPISAKEQIPLPL